MAHILDGKALAANQKPELQAKAQELTRRLRRPPQLAVILVGDDAASEIYVGRKTKLCEELGIQSVTHRLAATTTAAELEKLIYQLNHNDQIDGILLQLPLPGHIDRYHMIQSIDPAKDVDGLHPLNQGYLFQGQPRLVPCTPAGCIQLLQSCCPDLTGRRVTVIGSSVLVGRPLAALLLHQGATVTLANSKTRQLPELTQMSDIVISATGQPHLITADHIKEGAVVIDVGIIRVNGKLVGDVAFEQVAPKASFITPVPGGVGPMTIINLMANILKAAEERHHDAEAAKSS